MVPFLVQETIIRDINDLDEGTSYYLASPARCQVFRIACYPNYVHMIINRDLFYQHASLRRVPVPAKFLLDGKSALPIISYHKIVVTDAKTYSPDLFHPPVEHDLEIICWWPHHPIFALGGIFYFNGDINLAIRENRILFKNKF